MGFLMKNNLNFQGVGRYFKIRSKTIGNEPPGGET